MGAKEHKILESARNIAAAASGWADVSNALFDPEEGLITRAYPTREEREAFLKTEEYRAIRELLLTAMYQTGLAAGARVVGKSPKANHGSRFFQ